MWNANMIIMSPLILPSHTLTAYDDAESAVLSNNPSTANMTENPNTKNTLLRKVCVLDGIFSVVLPDMYAMNPGIIGNMHGLKNETNPANTATKMFRLAI